MPIRRLERNLLERLLGPPLGLVRLAVVGHAEDPAVLAPPEDGQLGWRPVRPVLEAGLGEQLAALLTGRRVEVEAGATGGPGPVRSSLTVRGRGASGGRVEADRRLLLPEVEAHADQRGAL